MSGELDFSAAAEKLQEMLGSDDGKQQIEDIISMLGVGQEEQPENSENSEKSEKPEEGFGGFDMGNIEMMMKLQKIMSVMQRSDTTKQASFLRSLGPLLRPERRDKLNNAVRFLSVGKAIEVFKNM